MLSWLDYLPKGKTHIHIHIKCLSLSLNYYFVNLNFKNKRSYKSEDSFSIRREIEGDYFETNGSIWCFKCFNGDLWENILYIYMCVYIYIFFICILFIYMCVCVCVCVCVYKFFWGIRVWAKGLPFARQVALNTRAIPPALQRFF
jgi:hypothetical protein